MPIYSWASCHLRLPADWLHSCIWVRSLHLLKQRYLIKYTVTYLNFDSCQKAMLDSRTRKLLNQEMMISSYLERLWSQIPEVRYTDFGGLMLGHFPAFLLLPQALKVMPLLLCRTSPQWSLYSATNHLTDDDIFSPFPGRGRAHTRLKMKEGD